MTGKYVKVDGLENRFRLPANKGLGSLPLSFRNSFRELNCFGRMLSGRPNSGARAALMLSAICRTAEGFRCAPSITHCLQVEVSVVVALILELFAVHLVGSPAALRRY